MHGACSVSGGVHLRMIGTLVAIGSGGAALSRHIYLFGDGLHSRSVRLRHIMHSSRCD